MPIQHVLVCQENRVPLTEGVTVVGRALGCGIRFNTATVSRQHLKLVIAGDRLTAENLSTTTGTLVNGKRVMGMVSLRSGDRVQCGPHLMTIEAEEVTRDEPLAVSEADTSDEIFPDEEQTGSGREPTRIPLHALAARHAPSAIESHTCPRCRARVAFAESVCSACGYSWGPTHPSSITERITLPIINTIADRAPAVAPVASAVPVIYSSEEMTLDVTVSDIRTGGLFIPSELLDTPSTACELTILPDGHPVVTIHGVVRKVRQRADATGPAGLEIEFTEVPADAAAWLAARVTGRA